MSSIGSSDSPDRGADKSLLRRTREEFRQRESDLIKRHNVENRRLNERHEDEIERIKTQHADQMQNAKEHSTETFSKRDHQYQRDIEDLRNMHRKQLQTAADEGQRRDENLRKTIANDTSQRAKYNDDRFEQLSEEYGAEGRRVAETFAERSREQKEAQGQAITRLRDGLNTRHEKELAALRETLGEKLDQTQRDFGAYRQDVNQQNVERRVRDIKVAHESGDNLMAAVDRERDARRQSEDQLRDGYRESLGEQRRRFDDALAERDDAHKKSATEFRASHNDRDTDRVGSLERENRELRAKVTSTEQKVRHQMGQELKHARQAFQNNVDAYRAERDEAYRRTNDGAGDDVQRERAKLENRLVEVTRDGRDKIHSQAREQRAVLEQVKGDFAARTEQSELNADQRVDQILAKTDEEKSRLIDRERFTHAETQREKHEQIKALRETFEDDKQAVVEQMREQMRRQELRHQERLGVVVGKYDKQVQSLKDDLFRERKAGAEHVKRITEELGRAHQRELDQADAKSRAKLAEINDHHDRDVRDVSRRYEEKLDQVLGEIKKQ